MPDKGDLKKIFVASFEQKEIENTYLPRYTEMRKKRGLKTLWSVEQYVKKIEDLNLWGLISNPFTLRIMADTLPDIVEGHKKK